MSELDKFKRRLVRSVSRLLKQDREPQDAAWEQLKKETGCDCKLLWERMRALTIKKMKRLLAADDQNEHIASVARLSATDWLLFDLVLVHEKLDVIGRDQLGKGGVERPILEELFELVIDYDIETKSATRLLEAWNDLTHFYNLKGRQVSPMLLQRRWYQLKEATRASFYKLWNNYRGNQKLWEAASLAKPTALQANVAKNFPYVVTQPFAEWEELIQMQKVITPEQFEAHNRANNRPKTVDEKPDLLVIEPVIETIDLGEESDGENTKTYPKDNSQLNQVNLALVKQEPIEDGLSNVRILDATHVATELYEDNNSNSNLSSLNAGIDETNRDDLVLQMTNFMHTTIPVESSTSTDLNTRNAEPADELDAQDDTDIPDDLIKQKADEYVRRKIGKVLETQNVEKEIASVESVEEADDDDDIVDDIIKQKANDFVKKVEVQKLVNDVVDEFQLPSGLSFADDGIELMDDGIEDGEGGGDAVDIIKQKPPDVVIKVEDEEDGKEEEAASPTFDLKLLMEPVVYTTKLDDMVVFKGKKFDFVEFQNIIDSVIIESKPVSERAIKVDIENNIPSQSDLNESDQTTNDDLFRNDVVEQSNSNEVTVPTPNEDVFDNDSSLDSTNHDCDDLFRNDVVEQSNSNEATLPTPNEDVFDNDSSLDSTNDDYYESDVQIDESLKVKETSYLLKKPRNRNYNPIILCKNPDFNTRLKRLTVGFFSSERNRRLLSACKPMTIDVHKAFESKLVNGTLYIKSSGENPQPALPETENSQSSSVIPSAMPIQSLLSNDKSNVYIDDLTSPSMSLETVDLTQRSKTIKLRELSEIRRINQHLLTAQVPPMRVDNFSNDCMSHNPSVLPQGPIVRQSGEVNADKPIDDSDEPQVLGITVVQDLTANVNNDRISHNPSVLPQKRVGLQSGKVNIDKPIDDSDEPQIVGIRVEQDLTDNVSNDGMSHNPFVLSQGRIVLQSGKDNADKSIGDSDEPQIVGIRVEQDLTDNVSNDRISHNPFVLSQGCIVPQSGKDNADKPIDDSADSQIVGITVGQDLTDDVSNERMLHNPSALPQGRVLLQRSKVNADKPVVDLDEAKIVDITVGQDLTAKIKPVEDSAKGTFVNHGYTEGSRGRGRGRARGWSGGVRGGRGGTPRPPYVPMYPAKRSYTAPWLAGRLPKPSSNLDDFLITIDTLNRMINKIDGNDEFKKMHVKNKKPLWSIDKQARNLAKNKTTMIVTETTTKADASVATDDITQIPEVVENVSVESGNTTTKTNTTKTTTNKKSANKQYCCWSREKLIKLEKNGRVYGRHKCNNICSCCCRYDLLVKMQERKNEKCKMKRMKLQDEAIVLSDDEDFDARSGMDNDSNDARMSGNEDEAPPRPRVRIADSQFNSKNGAAAVTGRGIPLSVAGVSTTSTTITQPGPQLPTVQQNSQPLFRINISFAPTPQEGLPVTPAVIPAVNLSAASLSTVDVPAVDVRVADLPTVNIPTVDLSTTDLPAVNIPTVDLSGVDLPPADLPAVEVPHNTSILKAPTLVPIIQKKTPKVSIPKTFRNSLTGVKRKVIIRPQQPPSQVTVPVTYQSHAKTGTRQIVIDGSGSNTFISLKKSGAIHAEDRVMFLNSKSISQKPKESPIFVGKNKILLTTVKFPTNINEGGAMDQPLQPSKVIPTLPLPAGVQLMLMPNGELSYTVDPAVQLNDTQLAIIPNIIAAVQQQINISNQQTEPSSALNSISKSDESNMNESVIKSVQGEQTISETSNLLQGENHKSVDDQSKDTTDAPRNIMNDRSYELIESSKQLLGDQVTTKTSESVKTIKPGEEATVDLELGKDTTKNTIGQSKDTNALNAEDPEKEADASRSTVNVSNDLHISKDSEIITIEENDTLTNSDINNEKNVNDSASGNRNLLSDLMEMSGICAEDARPPVEVNTLFENPVMQVGSTSEPVNADNMTTLPELSPITSLSELRYACDHKGTFYKLDLDTGVIAPINVCIKKQLNVKSQFKLLNSRLAPKSVIDLTDDGEQEKPSNVLEDGTIKPIKLFKRVCRSPPSLLKKRSLLNKRRVIQIDKIQRSERKRKQSFDKIEAKIDLVDSDAPMEEEYLLESSDSDGNEPGSIIDTKTGESSLAKDTSFDTEDSSDEEPLAKKFSRLKETKIQQTQQKENDTVSNEKVAVPKDVPAASQDIPDVPAASQDIPNVPIDAPAAPAPMGPLKPAQLGVTDDDMNSDAMEIEESELLPFFSEGTESQEDCILGV